jgi:hypothetical protein
MQDSTPESTSPALTYVGEATPEQLARLKEKNVTVHRIEVEAGTNEKAVVYVQQPDRRCVAACLGVLAGLSLTDGDPAQQAKAMFAAIADDTIEIEFRRMLLPGLGDPRVLADGSLLTGALIAFLPLITIRAGESKRV